MTTQYEYTPISKFRHWLLMLTGAAGIGATITTIMLSAPLSMPAIIAIACISTASAYFAKKSAWASSGIGVISIGALTAALLATAPVSLPLVFGGALISCVTFYRGYRGLKLSAKLNNIFFNLFALEKFRNNEPINNTSLIINDAQTKLTKQAIIKHKLAKLFTSLKLRPKILNLMQAEQQLKSSYPTEQFKGLNAHQQGQKESFINEQKSALYQELAKLLVVQQGIKIKPQKPTKGSVRAKSPKELIISSVAQKNLQADMVAIISAIASSALFAGAAVAATTEVVYLMLGASIAYARNIRIPEKALRDKDSLVHRMLLAPAIFAGATALAPVLGAGKAITNFLIAAAPAGSLALATVAIPRFTIVRPRTNMLGETTTQPSSRRASTRVAPVSSGATLSFAPPAPPSKNPPGPCNNPACRCRSRSVVEPSPPRPKTVI